MKMNIAGYCLPGADRRERAVAGTDRIGDVVQSHVVVKAPSDSPFDHNLCCKQIHRSLVCQVICNSLTPLQLQDLFLFKFMTTTNISC